MRLLTFAQQWLNETNARWNTVNNKIIHYRRKRTDDNGSIIGIIKPQTFHQR